MRGDVEVPHGESVEACAVSDGEKSGGEGVVRRKENLVLGRTPWRVGGVENGDVELLLRRREIEN